MHPNNRRLVHTKGPSRQLRCHATVQHAVVPNAGIRAGLHVSVHMQHARRHPPLHPSPVPRACRRARPFARVLDAHLTRPIATVFFSPSLDDLETVPVGPVAGRCSCDTPFGFGRPRKPWPTCRCAWRCACTAATKFGGVL